MKYYSSILFSIFVLSVSLLGCDDIITEEPIIMDSAQHFEFTIDTTSGTFGESATISLEMAFREFSEADEINLFNITVMARAPEELPSETTLSGQIRIQTPESEQFHTIASITEMTFSELETEQSLFTDNTEGVTPSSEGVEAARMLYKQRPLPAIDLAFNGTVQQPDDTDERITFDFIITIYTQIHATP
jgi:hypothetical protein